MDKDHDGLISYSEFISETKENDFDKDEEWKPLTEEDQFTDEEYKEYERLLAESVCTYSFLFCLFVVTLLVFVIITRIYILLEIIRLRACLHEFS